MSNKDNDKDKNSQRLPIFGYYHTPYTINSHRAIKRSNTKSISVKPKNSEYCPVDWRSQKCKFEGGPKKQIENSGRRKYMKQDYNNTENRDETTTENTNNVNKECSNKESLIKKVVNFFKVKKKSSSQSLNTIQTYTELEPTEMLERSNRKIVNKKKKKKKNEVKQTKKAKSFTAVNVINEPGTVHEISPLEDYNTNRGYEDLIEQIKVENEKINLIDVRCNSPCNPGDLIIDKTKTVTFIFKRSPLMNLLLYQDEIVRINGENFEVDEEECILPVEACQRLDLVIKRRGRSMAIPYKRQLSINLDMEYGYYYFVITVPRIKNQLIGIDFYNTSEDGVIIQHVIKNTVAYHLFSQGDYICDVNGIPIKTSEDFYKIITEDKSTFPTFSCVVKRSCAKPTQLKVVKTLFECPEVQAKSDIMKIVKNEEQKLNDFKKRKPCTILKKTSLLSQDYVLLSKCKKSNTSINNNKNIEKSKHSKISPCTTTKKVENKNVKIVSIPKTKIIESDIENVIFTNPVLSKFSTFE